MILQESEVMRLQAYLQTTFGNSDLVVRTRPKAPDSAEILVRGEFIGTLYKDEDDGEISYSFTMSILEMDLPRTS